MFNALPFSLKDQAHQVFGSSWHISHLFISYMLLFDLKSIVSVPKQKCYAHGNSVNGNGINAKQGIEIIRVIAK
tara:strand:+ start:186322 stop:186543 length:222 start_codon:yes stop_codon:yes gene_type:complete